jgi:hypothetical protein
MPTIDLFPPVYDLSGPRPDESHDALEGRTLSHAVPPKEGDDLPPFHVQGDILKNVTRPVNVFKDLP